MTLKAKIFAAASVNAGLQALLGAPPAAFRMFDTQLQQGELVNGACVVVQVISNPKTYTVGGRLATSWARVQFTVFGTGDDSENASAVVAALASFLDQFNTIGISGLPAYPHLIVGDRDAGVAQTDPLTYQRIVDVMIFDNENVSS